MIDVFVSYAGEDAAWARTLAGKFIAGGLTVFFDEWDVLPGDVVLHRLDEAIRDSMACVAVVSPALFRSPRAMEEHAALMRRDIRFIPVLIGNTDGPRSGSHRRTVTTPRRTTTTGCSPSCLPRRPAFLRLGVNALACRHRFGGRRGRLTQNLLHRFLRDHQPGQPVLLGVQT
ncbi:toll/interleukin-1 receptor domain-containing protein [Nonomuraea sp. NPDC050451]|uniref:toll/interleukin-1 receptor domain-containing protein n=1 Tax=Nonomuraea sp. NPDC050451 TaxID=3364364 RepID=UPI0037ADF1BC